MSDLKFDDLKYLAIPLPREVDCYKFSGDFDGEIACIDRWLERNLPADLRRRLEIERFFAEGLKDDYNMTFEDMLAGIRERYPMADEKALETVIGFNNVDFILRNGERRFQNSAVENVFRTHTDYLESLKNGVLIENNAPGFYVADAMKTMRETGSCAYRFEVEQKLWLNPEYERPGKKIRVWIPYPVECETQSEITLLESSHPVRTDNALLRTAYFEKEYEVGDVFSVRYSYVNRAKYNKLDPSKVSAVQPPIPEFTREIYPHVRFTPLIRSLAKEIAGDETNPLIIATKIFDWIRDNVDYSLVREYLYIDNIPEFVILNRYGDCGLQGLTFITLCRALDIPAKWQSGDSIRPDHIGSHDWTMFYVAPFGWLYCDPSHGNSTNKEKHEHYFGNLDPFRLVTCNDFQLELTPPKKFMRMDPYDNQSGEAEYEDENIFFPAINQQRRVLKAVKID